MNSFHLSFLVKGQNPNLAWYYYEANILNIFLLSESLITIIYPCGGTYIYIDVLSEDLVLITLSTRRRPYYGILTCSYGPYMGIL